MQHVRDTLSRALGAAQLQKDLAFQIEQISLLYLTTRSSASCKHSRQTAPYDYVVFAELLSGPAFI